MNCNKATSVLIIGLAFFTLISIIGKLDLANAQIDVTKLTGNEKIEITGTLQPNRYGDQYYEFADKPIVKINGQVLDFEYPENGATWGSIDESNLAIDFDLKIPVTNTLSIVRNFDIPCDPDSIEHNPSDGSTTYRTNSDCYIIFSDVFFNNLDFTVVMNKDKTGGSFHATAQGKYFSG
ncbi:MAG: hypothetical protein R2685_07810 [Candidatus Nitrosocosmicus sp.]|nr:hypothetical protein [Candidatus Nitrosocosmicus sp.]